MQNAVLVRLGAVTFVNPTAELNLSPRQWGKLDAAIWLSPLMKERAREMVAEVEEGLGVTQADRRYARLVHKGQVIVPAKAGASVITFGPALFIDEGKSERVLVLTDAKPHPESGEPEREVSFVDRDGEVFIVKAANLCPCDDLWRALPLAPEALETGKWAGVPQNAEGYQAALKSKAPVMDKFDRVAPVKPEDVRLDLARMTPNQRERLRVADAKLVSAEQRKAFRQKVVAGQVVGYGRMTAEERDERADYKAEMARLQDETLAANDRAEVSRGRVETLALEQMRGGSFRSAKPGVFSKEGGELCRKNGLDTLLMSGALTVIEHAAGEKYAGIVDEAKASLKIANWSSSGGGSPDPETERLQRLKLVAAQQRVTFLHAVVQARVKSPRAVMVLRRVAGEGALVSHFSKGSGRALNVQALKGALGALADMWGLQ
jgi:hypothetical protein